MARIEFDYARASKQVQELLTLSDELTRFANARYAQIIEESTAGWQGSTADRFLVKCGQTKAELIKHAKELEKKAASLRLVAKTLRDAEERIIKLRSQ